MRTVTKRGLRATATVIVAGVALGGCDNAGPAAPAAPENTIAFSSTPIPLAPGKLYVCKFGTNANFQISVFNVNGVLVKTFTPAVADGECQLIDNEFQQFPLFTATVTEVAQQNVRVDVIRKDTIVGQATSTQVFTGTSTVTTSYGLEVGSTLEFYNTVLTPNLVLTKSAGSATVNAGSPISFTMTLTNTGEGTAVGTTLTDPLPGGNGVSWSVSAQPAGNPCSIAGAAPNQTLNCNFGDLAKNGSVSVTVSSSTTTASCKTYDNTATAHASNQGDVQASASTTVLCPTCPPNTINSNFNGTFIPATSYIWFNSVVKVTGVPSTGAVINFTSSVAFNAAGTLAVPNATITFSPSATTASTVFNSGTNTWETTVPVSYTGNVFLSGLSYLVPPGGIPGGQNPVSWSGTFTSNVPSVTFSWKWAAAVYNTFSNYPNLNVKPVDGSNPPSVFNGVQYTNSDHAGTPEGFKTFVIGGARGGGGSNFTGSYSGTGRAVPCQ